MKKVAVLLLAAGLVFGAAHKGAQAADIKGSGEWDFNTEWNNIGFAKEKADICSMPASACARRWISSRPNP